jgi:hypothetical protein
MRCEEWCNGPWGSVREGEFLSSGASIIFSERAFSVGLVNN